MATAAAGDGMNSASDDDVGELTSLLDDSSDDEVKQQRKLVCRFILIKINVQKHRFILCGTYLYV